MLIFECPRFLQRQLCVTVDSYALRIGIYIRLESMDFWSERSACASAEVAIVLGIFRFAASQYLLLSACLPVRLFQLAIYKDDIHCASSTTLCRTGFLVPNFLEAENLLKIRCKMYYRAPSTLIYCLNISLSVA